MIKPWLLGCQNLLYSIISLDRFEVVQEGTIPLPKGRTLKWIGISEEGVSTDFPPYDPHLPNLGTCYV